MGKELAGPADLFMQTADVVGCSESTLRRRAEKWNWAERLEAYDSGILQQVSEARTTKDLTRYTVQLEAFRQEQLARAQSELGNQESFLPKEQKQ